MWELIVFILSLINPAIAPTDYVGPVAAEVAYAAAMPTTTPVKPKVPTSECKNCKGAGRVRTGDGLGWTKCPECESDIELDTTSDVLPIITD